jgi:ABC-type polysaccharide/polyol phosphate export permease
MGLPQQDVGPIFVGSIVIMIVILGVVTAEHHVFDLAGNRFIDYLQTLPLSLPFLFLSFVLTNIIRTALVGRPLFICGIFILGNKLVIAHTSWLPLLTITILSFLFISLFALCLVYYSNLRWYIDNIWPCILSPILTLGALLFTFSSIQKFSPPFALLFACNPLTYIAEGVRSTLIGGPQFINTYYCIAALIVSISLCVVVLIKNITSQLDPVYHYEHKQ